MADLIDRDALIDFIDLGHLRNPLESCYSERDVVDMLEARPTVDAVPVVHGRWEVAIGYDPNKKVQCQNCYKMAHDPTAFCPNCGAKMDDTAPCEWCQHYKADPKMPVSRGNGQYTALTITTVPTAELT